MKRKHLVLTLGCQMVMLALSLNAYAQQVLTPGSVLQDIQQKTVPSPLQTDTQRKEPPSAEVEDTQKPHEPDKEVEETKVKKVLIQQITVEGVTLLDDKTVRETVAPYENKQNSFAELQELTDKLTTMYRDMGYVTSRVYIPPQKLQQGQLKLQALEGKMGEMEVKEGRWFKARSVKYGFALDNGDPFNLNTLKVSLRNLNENPDRNVRAVLKPGEKTGDTDVQLEIVDRFPFHIVPTWDNLGRQNIGDNRLGARIIHNNLLGFGDSAMSSLSFTRRSRGVVNHYQIPIGHRGTMLTFDHAYSWLKLGEQFAPLDIKGTATSFSPGITQVLLNRERYKLYADLAFDFKQLETTLAGSDFQRDQLRILRPGINLEEYDKWGRTFMRHEIGWGLDVFGATSGFQPLASRVGAGSKFFRYTATLVRTQRLPWNTYAIFRALGQLSPDRLVSAEQFQAGGAFTVRGYREGVIAGDNGVVLSAEWRMPFFLVPKTCRIPGTDYTLRDNVQVVTFVDYGAINVNKPAAGVARNEDILGAGFGLRFKLTRFLTGRMDVAFPLIDIADDHMGRVHFGLESNLF